MFNIYIYKGCSTCRNAVKWLQDHGVPHKVKAIRDTPPTQSELRAAIAANGGVLRKVFNTSGSDYREMGLAKRMADLTEAEALKLLSANGNLVKRPFLVGKGIALTGFKIALWRKSLLTTAPA